MQNENIFRVLTITELVEQCSSLRAKVLMDFCDNDFKYGRTYYDNDVGVVKEFDFLTTFVWYCVEELHIKHEIVAAMMRKSHHRSEIMSITKQFHALYRSYFEKIWLMVENDIKKCVRHL